MLASDYFLAILFSFSITNTLSRQNISLPLSQPVDIITPGLSEVQINVPNIGDKSFILVQVHTQKVNLTLSYDKYWSPQRSVTGRDVGLIVTHRNVHETVILHLNISSSPAGPVHIIAYARAFTSDYPVPGGCNLEFPTENAPYLHLFPGRYYNTLQYQFASVGSNTSSYIILYHNNNKDYGALVTQSTDCESELNRARLEYEIYVYYIQERSFSDDSYTRVIKSVLSFPDIQANGAAKLTSLNSNDRSSIKISSAPRQGVIYTVVVRDLATKRSVSYVPIVTYACDWQVAVNETVNSELPTCQHTHSIATWAALALTAILGLFLLFAAHHYFRVEMFIAGALFGGLLSYIVTYNVVSGSVSLPVIILTCCVGSLAFGLIWLAVWARCRTPVFSVLLPSLLAGFLFASLVFATPLGALPIFFSPVNYGLMFACFTLLLPVVLLGFTYRCNIICASFLGSHALVLCADGVTFGSVSKLLLTSVYRATLSHRGYHNVYQTFPFQLADILLCAAWAALFTAGCCFQLYRNRGQPRFPVDDAGAGSLQGVVAAAGRGRVEEHQRLLVDATNYGAVSQQQPDDVT